MIEVPSKPRRVMMVASGGGHWVELMRLIPALEGCSVAFVTVLPDYAPQARVIDGARFYVVRDVTRWNKIRWIQTVFQLICVLVRERPDVVISTGALPGYFALRLAKLVGAETVWVDSIANVDELSRSGQVIGPHVSLWLTQWPHLARANGPRYEGAVL
jgi:UDP-N-acetylglucosamine:LPS N-acetylglucosamine transferase